jgi:predicted DNA-binding protein (MmcQ/YjbR family)
VAADPAEGGFHNVDALALRSGWNSLIYTGIPDDELLEAVDESYRLVVGKLPKRDRPDGWDER